MYAQRVHAERVHGLCMLRGCTQRAHTQAPSGFPNLLVCASKGGCMDMCMLRGHMPKHQQGHLLQVTHILSYTQKGVDAWTRVCLEGACSSISRGAVLDAVAPRCISAPWCRGRIHVRVATAEMPLQVLSCSWSRPRP